MSRIVSTYSESEHPVGVVFMAEESDNAPSHNMSISIDLNEYLERFRLKENGGRRLGIDRRRYSYTLYIPERRSGQDRRVGKDRRKTPRLGSRLTSTR